MSVQKTLDFGDDGPQYELTCDCCGKAGGLYEEFLGAVAAKKNKAWISKKEGGLWSDLCKDCKEKT